MTTPLVTVGIPFFDNEDTLRHAVNSTLGQTHSRLEVILIDDGSTDSSLSIARICAKADPRISVITDGVNRGLINRLNQLIDLAQGEYFARMDADDLMDPERIAKQLACLVVHPEVDVVTSGVFSLDANFQVLGKRFCDARTPKTHEVFRNGGGLVHASMMAKTSWFRENKYRTGYERAEDRELFTRTFGKSVYKILPEPLYYYRDVQGITLPKYLASYRSERKALRANWRGRIPFTTCLLYTSPSPRD